MMEVDAGGGFTFSRGLKPPFGPVKLTTDAETTSDLRERIMSKVTSTTRCDEGWAELDRRGSTPGRFRAKEVETGVLQHATTG